MNDLNKYDFEYFDKKLKKINYENDLLNKKDKKKLSDLLEIKTKQIKALENIFNYLNSITSSNKLSSSELEEMYYDEKDLLKELDLLNKFINKVK
jgi:hypothetical protein